MTSRLVLVLSSLPSGLPRSRLQDYVNRMRPFCRGVGYHIDELAELTEIDLSNSYNPIMVLQAAACAASAPSDLRELFSSLQSRRAKVMVQEIGSEKEAIGYLALGADMVSMRRPQALD